MGRKIVGITVGTPTSPRKMGDVLKPVKTVNGVAPDEDGNVELPLEIDRDQIINYIDEYISEALGGDY